MESDANSTWRTLLVRMLRHVEVDYQNALCNTRGERVPAKENALLRWYE